MNHNYEKLFSDFALPEPPDGLTEKTLLRISKHERRMLAIKIAASACVFSVSIGVVIEGYINMVTDLSRSGFFQLSSLMFSNFSSTAANFPDFAFSIAESFPVFTAAILLSGVMFAIWSMAALIDETAHFRSIRAGMSIIV